VSSVAASAPAGIALADAMTLGAAAPQVVEVYAHAFDAPPWCEGPTAVARFGTRLSDHARREGFACCLAREEGDRIVGFAYGATTRRNHPCCTVAWQALAARYRAVLDGRFEVVELAVAPHAQGRGIGGRLLDELIEESAPLRSAWLVTRADAQPALTLYHRRGWRVLTDITVGGSSRLVLIHEPAPDDVKGHR
jgi:ribosomal protein S18 acetylase RimI-like enzyme